MPKAAPKVTPQTDTTTPRQSLAILDLIEGGDYPDLVAAILDHQGGDINWVHPETGLPLLHYAVGLDRPETVRLFLRKGATVGPDAHGRWPSILALQCECSDEVCDLIEGEEALLQTQPAKSQTATSQPVSAPAAKTLPSDKAKPGVYSYFEGKIIEEKPVNPLLVDLDPDEVLRRGRGDNRTNNNPSIPGPIKRR